MNRRIIHITATLLVTLSLAGCSDWTEPEAIYEPAALPVGEGRSEQYYENLRMFKATMMERKISWAWYGGWTGIGADLYHSLSGLPDSLDVVSMWGGWDFNGLTTYESRLKDMKYIQKVKGTKIVATDLIGSFDLEKLKEFGWEGDIDPQGATVAINNTSLYTAPLTAAQEEAIRKYARWIVDRVLTLGYDGYDIDYEMGWGSRGTLVQYLERMKVYVDEISKFMGPKSGTGKLFVLDGAIQNMPTPEMAHCFDWLVIQAYNSNSYSSLNSGAGTTGANRFGSAVDRLKGVMSIEQIAAKTVMTENYEGGQGTNGGVPHSSEFHGTVNSLLGMALWQPVYDGIRYPRSGGCGSYHVEYEYTANHPKIGGFYPFTRESIQAMNPANIN